MIKFDSLATDYLAAFGATDPVVRHEKVKALFAENVTYVDPMAAVVGHDQLAVLICGVQEQFPGWVFSPIGEIDAHHNQARFGWGLGPVEEEPPVLGFDVVVVDDDGKISTVYGFLDRVPTS